MRFINDMNIIAINTKSKRQEFVHLLKDERIKLNVFSPVVQR